MSAAPPALLVDLSPSDATGTGWHTELGAGSADLGRVHVGPTAFAHRVGVLVGYPLSPAIQGERIASAVRILEALDDGHQWYSETRTADPFGAAQWMVQAHDELRTLGWEGNALTSSPRLAAISALRQGVEDAALPPGLPDVLHGLIAALERRVSAVPLDIHLDAPRSSFPPLLGSLLAAIEAQGHTVSELPPQTGAAPADTDLGRLQHTLLGFEQAELTGDGTLRILQGQGPWEAAALATALLGDDAVWLLSGEAALLDRVRSRFDRPRLGVGAASRWRPALQVLPLALALQTGPQDPQTALELLTLPICPVPGSIRHALVKALSDQPAVGSPSWDQALDQTLSAYVEEYPDTDREKLRTRISTLLPTAPGPTLTAAEAVVVAQQVANWARVKGARDNDGLLLAASSIATDLARSLERLPADRPLDRLQLAQLHDLALSDGVATDVEAEAGAPTLVESPGTVPLICQELVWFGLIAGNAELGRDTGWTPTERTELEGAGARLPREGELRALEQDSWLRAVLAPSASLTLVTWESAGAGAAEPHPLLDLWSTRIQAGGLQAITTTAAEFLSSDDERVRGIDPANQIKPRGTWRLGDGVISTERTWSASSIEKLITCPLGWALKYPAKLHPGAADALPRLAALAGTFAHALFATVLFEDEPGWDALTPELAQRSLHSLFDARVAVEAAPLTLPANRAYTERLRRQLGHAIAALVRQLRAGRWRPEAPEKDVSELGGSFAGQPLSGSIDLLVRRDDGKRGVVDLKLGGRKYRAKSLRSGTSIQLAVYAKAAAGGPPPLPPVAYFILEDGELLTTDTAAFPDASEVAGPGAGETLLDAERAWKWWAQAVRKGLIIGRGKHIVDALEGEDLTEAVGSAPPVHPWVDEMPSCHFCDAQRLCEFSLQGGAQ
jgi:ATP-dependent helicase/nuclease subunit B